MMADRTEAGGAASKSRPAPFTPGSLAPLVSSLRASGLRSASGQESVRGEAGTGGSPSVLPTSNPYRPLVETPDDWEMGAETDASPVNPPAPAVTDVNLTSLAPDAEAKSYEHVDIAYALITNRLNTQSVPADAAPPLPQGLTAAVLEGARAAFFAETFVELKTRSGAAFIRRDVVGAIGLHLQRLISEKKLALRNPSDVFVALVADGAGCRILRQRMWSLVACVVPLKGSLDAVVPLGG